MKQLISLYQLAEQESITIDWFELKSRDTLSHMDTNGSCYIAISPQALESSLDEKMKLAHEMGHCITGAFYNEHSPCDIRQKHERRADRWAIEELIPKDELDRAVENGCTEVWDLAECFDVTEDFMHKTVEFYQQVYIGFENT